MKDTLLSKRTPYLGAMTVCSRVLAIETFGGFT